MRFFALMQPLQQYKSATQQQWMNCNAAGYNNCIRLTNKIKKMPINKTCPLAIVVLATVAISACNSPVDTKQSGSADTITKSPVAVQAPLREKVLSAADQAALTPDMIIQSLKDGNARFMKNEITARDHSAMVRNASLGQYPKAVILSCLDSRIPVEDILIRASAIFCGTGRR